MRNYSAKDVDFYIASSPEEARPHLQALRKIITSTIPNVEEGISWGVPILQISWSSCWICPIQEPR